MERGAYGPRVARHFRLTEAPMLLAGGPGEDVKIAVTRLRSDVGMNERTTVPAREGAFSIHLHMRDSPNHQLWLKGKKVFEGGYRSGTTSLVNLEEEPAARIGNPFDFLQVYVPSGSLDDIAADLGRPSVRELVWPRGEEDPAAAGLARLLVQAMESERSNTLFADQILLALRVHVVNTYGAASAVRPRTGGGLAAWQERRAKDILESRFAEFDLNRRSRARVRSVTEPLHPRVPSEHRNAAVSLALADADRRRKAASDGERPAAGRDCPCLRFWRPELLHQNVYAGGRRASRRLAARVPELISAPITRITACRRVATRRDYNRPIA